MDSDGPTGSLDVPSTLAEESGVTPGGWDRRHQPRRKDRGLECRPEAREDGPGNTATLQAEEGKGRAPPRSPTLGPGSSGSSSGCQRERFDKAALTASESRKQPGAAAIYNSVPLVSQKQAAPQSHLVGGRPGWPGCAGAACFGGKSRPRGQRCRKVSPWTGSLLPPSSGAPAAEALSTEGQHPGAWERVGALVPPPQGSGVTGLWTPGFSQVPSVILAC